MVGLKHHHGEKQAKGAYDLAHVKPTGGKTNRSDDNQQRRCWRGRVTGRP